MWGYDYEGDERTLNIHIKRVWDRLSALTVDVTISTVRGGGNYRESTRRKVTLPNFNVLFIFCLYWECKI